DISMQTTKEGPYQSEQDADKMLQTWGLEQMRDWTLPEGADGTEPCYSPIYRSADEMKGMPNTVVIVGEGDRLLTDAVATVRVLNNLECEASSSTKLVVLEGQTHNHSAHVGLRDGIFTPDLIAAIIRGESPLALEKSSDGLGVLLLDPTAASCCVEVPGLSL
ncbi:MAG: alpha/beta hydrolase fold domain-containing protein, partial [Gammaproteobacteria bacterium]|nr:alpha/beta hydrolase fold domain-containing protein [Gammaproteobacteria bacterium]